MVIIAYSVLRYRDCTSRQLSPCCQLDQHLPASDPDQTRPECRRRIRPADNLGFALQQSRHFPVGRHEGVDENGEGILRKTGN